MHVNVNVNVKWTQSTPSRVDHTTVSHSHTSLLPHPMARDADKFTDVHFTMYRMITHGGDAELELNDRIDPFTEGINFAVRPPRKA